MCARYQSRALEISGTARWMESKGGASYCAHAGVESMSATAHAAALRTPKPMTGSYPLGWLRHLVGFSSGRGELEHLVVGRVHVLSAAAGKDEVAPNHEEFAVVRGDVDAVPGSRHRRQLVPVVDGRIEHLHVTERPLDVIGPLFAAGDVDPPLVGRPAFAAARRGHAV